MKFSYLALAVTALTSLSAPAMAAETFDVPFTQPDGGVSTGLYSGIVNVRVAMTGFSNGPLINDAFYFVPSGSRDGSYYQLTFGTAPLVAYNPAQNAVNFIVGGLPAYRSDHVYDFKLNTGATTPTQLHFGVSDGYFPDNGGGYRVTIGSVPEPAQWAMMLSGFAFAGLALRSRRQRVRFVAA